MGQLVDHAIRIRTIGLLSGFAGRKQSQLGATSCPSGSRRRQFFEQPDHFQGGLGAFEAAAVVALALFNVPLEAAIAFAVIAHAFQLGSALVLATLTVIMQKVDYRSLLKAAQKPDSAD